jgi:hypothetical protein
MGRDIAIGVKGHTRRSRNHKARRFTEGNEDGDFESVAVHPRAVRAQAECLCYPSRANFAKLRELQRPGTRGRFAYYFLSLAMLVQMPPALALRTAVAMNNIPSTPSVTVGKSQSAGIG